MENLLGDESVLLKREEFSFLYDNSTKLCDFDTLFYGQIFIYFPYLIFKEVIAG